MRAHVRRDLVIAHGAFPRTTRRRSTSTGTPANIRCRRDGSAARPSRLRAHPHPCSAPPPTNVPRHAHAPLQRIAATSPCSTGPCRSTTWRRDRTTWLATHLAWQNDIAALKSLSTNRWSSPTHACPRWPTAAIIFCSANACQRSSSPTRAQAYLRAISSPHILLAIKAFAPSLLGHTGNTHRRLSLHSSAAPPHRGACPPENTRCLLSPPVHHPYTSEASRSSACLPPPLHHRRRSSAAAPETFLWTAAVKPPPPSSSSAR